MAISNARRAYSIAVAPDSFAANLSISFLTVDVSAYEYCRKTSATQASEVRKLTLQHFDHLNPNKIARSLICSCDPANYLDIVQEFALARQPERATDPEPSRKGRPDSPGARAYWAIFTVLDRSRMILSMPRAPTISTSMIGRTAWHPGA